MNIRAKVFVSALFMALVVNPGWALVGDDSLSVSFFSNCNVMYTSGYLPEDVFPGAGICMMYCNYKNFLTGVEDKLQQPFINCTSCDSGYDLTDEIVTVMTTEPVHTIQVKVQICANKCAAGEYYSYGTCFDCPYDGKSLRGANNDITKCFSTGGSDASGKYVYDNECYFTK